MSERRTSWTGLVLMGIFGLWAGGLGVGFAVVLAVAHDRLGPGRQLIYILLGAFLVVLAARTFYELFARIRSKT